MRLHDAPSGSLFVNSRNHRAASEIESATTTLTARRGRRSLFTHSEQLKKIAFDPAICTSFLAMKSVLGVAESAVLKYMIQSHELRTPLNAIIGLTEMMVKDEASASEG
jgi:signal transduction histidine kinase